MDLDREYAKRAETERRDALKGEVERRTAQLEKEMSDLKEMFDGCAVEEEDKLEEDMVFPMDIGVAL